MWLYKCEIGWDIRKAAETRGSYLRALGYISTDDKTYIRNTTKMNETCKTPNDMSLFKVNWLQMSRITLYFSNEITKGTLSF